MGFMTDPLYYEKRKINVNSEELEYFLKWCGSSWYSEQILSKQHWNDLMQFNNIVWNSIDFIKPWDSELTFHACNFSRNKMKSFNVIWGESTAYSLESLGSNSETALTVLAYSM